jgi:hypothetical protein
MSNEPNNRTKKIEDLMTSAAQETILDVMELVEDTLKQADYILDFLEDFKHEVRGKIIDEPDDLTLRWLLNCLIRTSTD